MQPYDGGAQADIFEPEDTQHSERAPAGIEVAAPGAKGCENCAL
jgi:hypothetical protein